MTTKVQKSSSVAPLLSAHGPMSGILPPLSNEIVAPRGLRRARSGIRLALSSEQQALLENISRAGRVDDAM